MVVYNGMPLFQSNECVEGSFQVVHRMVGPVAVSLK